MSKQNEIAYQWRKGSVHPTDPAVAAEALQKLKDQKGGKIEAADLVQAAKSKSHPLHAEFEWSDTKAAQEYRLHQARGVINSLQVVRVERPLEPVRKFQVVSLASSRPDEPKRVYRDIEDILKDPNQRAELLQRALSELLAVRKKYHGLQELAVVFREFDRVLETTEA